LIVFAIRIIISIKGNSSVEFLIYSGTHTYKIVSDFKRFTLRVTAYDLEKSLIFVKTVEITSHARFLSDSCINV